LSLFGNRLDRCHVGSCTRYLLTICRRRPFPFRYRVAVLDPVSAVATADPSGILRLSDLLEHASLLLFLVARDAGTAGGYVG
jgi:hypothetical protein